MLKKARYLILASCLIALAGCTSSSSSDDNDDDNDSGSNGSGDSISDDPSTGGDSSGGDSDLDSDNNGGSQDGSNSGTRMVDMLGTVGIFEGDVGSGFGRVVGASGSFIGYSESFEVPANTGDIYAPLIGTCTVSNSENIDPTSPDIEPDESVEFEFIDAGSPITITSNGADYLNLTRFDLGNNSPIFYGSEEKSPPMATGLVLNVPGSQFPSFSNIPMRTVSQIELDSPANGGAVRFDTQFSWQGSSDPDGLVLIDASSFNTFVSCIASDTGSFEFPADTQNELGTGFFASDYSISRFTFDIHFKDSAALMVFSLNTDNNN